jgi:protein-tyrosine phosphatase
VSNFRDIGGFMTHDGKRVKQGMVYRSAQLNGVTAEGLAVCLEDLALMTELDLRGSGAPVLGSTVTRKVIPMQWYQHIFKPENYASTRQTIAAFAAEENYPINFHCSMGRDRTGTTAFLILGLLGVDQEILQKEYFSSYLSQAGAFNPEEFQLQIININGLINGFKPYAPEGTLQEQIEAYLLAAGITEAEIASIRAILLED